MPIYETFRRRRDRAAKSGEPEIYVYDAMRVSLVNQIIMIWDDALPNGRDVGVGDQRVDSDAAWEFVERCIARAFA